MILYISNLLKIKQKYKRTKQLRGCKKDVSVQKITYFAKSYPSLWYYRGY
jgi:hypothetical protein